MLDEIEELDLVLQHYAITWGAKFADAAELEAQWSQWGMKPMHTVDEEDSEDQDQSQ